MSEKTTRPSIEATVRSVGNRFVSRFPAFEPPLMRCRAAYVWAYVESRRVRAALFHDAPIDPYRMVAVDPHRIEYAPDAFDVSKFKCAGAVVGGGWDRTEFRFEDLDVYHAYEAHFDRGVPWSDTAFYHRVCAEIDAGHEPWGCATREAFDRRCERLDALYRRIDEEGYKTQEELMEDEECESIGKRRHTTLDRKLEDEIAIHVGRSGELLFADGRNRLSIVKLLDLDEVPVRVLARHAQWQAFRDAVARGDVAPGRYADHPDLDPVVDGSGQ